VDSQFWKKQPTKASKTAPRRVLDVEDFDNYDHWTRDCRVRSEAWFAIESWARETGFHMVAYKSKKRLYQKGMAPDSFVTFLEVRHEEGRVVLKSWIEVSSKMRWLSLFHLPKELKIEPTGFWGVRIRRRACREINDLLVRLKQPEIAQSQYFHWGDLELTTLGLIGLLPLPMLLFILGLVGKIDIAAGLSNSLLSLFGERLILICGVGISFVLIHHWVVIKHLRKEWANLVSFSVSAILFITLNIFLFTRTSREMLDQKLVHYCVSHFSEVKCQNQYSALSPSERTAFAKKLEVLQKSLALKRE
jgi:hypothetical protein